MRRLRYRAKHCLEVWSRHARDCSKYVVLSLVLSCGSDASPSSCDLDDEPRVEFTRVSLVQEFSSSFCPEIDPAALNASLGDAGAEACEISIQGCRLRVGCRVQGVTGGGDLTLEMNTFSGVLEVTDPIDCAYSVQAAQR